MLLHVINLKRSNKLPCPWVGLASIFFHVSRSTWSILTKIVTELPVTKGIRVRGPHFYQNVSKTTKVPKHKCIHKFSMPFKSICVKVEKVYKFRQERDTCISCTYQNYKARSNLRSWTWPRRGKAPRKPAFHTLHSQGWNRHTTELHQNKGMVINTTTSYRN